MFAPPGIDSDTSSGEPDSPVSSPKSAKKESLTRPHFSFKSLLQPSQGAREVKYDRENKEQLKGSSRTEVAEATAVPAKKRVRIVVDGDPEEVKEVKVENLPEESVTATIQDGTTLPAAPRSDENPARRSNQASDEMLILIRKLIADSAADRREPSKPDLPFAKQLISPKDARDKLKHRLAPTKPSPSPRSGLKSADPRIVAGKAVKRRPTPFRPTGSPEEEPPSALLSETKAPFPSAPLPQSHQPYSDRSRHKTDNADHHLNRYYYNDAPSFAQQLERDAGRRAVPGVAHDQRPQQQSAPPRTKTFDTDRQFFTSQPTERQGDRFDQYSDSDRPIPPLSYQPLRAYRMGQEIPGVQGFYPAKRDPRKAEEGKRDHRSPRKDAQRPGVQNPPNCTSPMQHQVRPTQTGQGLQSPSTLPITHPAPLESYSAQYPPPAYPHPPSVQPWQPYYPTFYHPQAQRPVSHDNILTFSDDGPSSPSPLSAPIQPSEKWSPLPIPWPSPRLRKSLKLFPKHEPLFTMDDLTLKPAPSSPRSPQRTGGNGLPGSMRGEIFSPAKTKMNSPRVMVKRSDGVREVEPYPSSKEVSPVSSQQETDPLSIKQQAENLTPKRGGNRDRSTGHTRTPDEVDNVVDRGMETRPIERDAIKNGLSSVDRYADEVRLRRGENNHPSKDEARKPAEERTKDRTPEAELPVANEKSRRTGRQPPIVTELAEGRDSVRAADQKPRRDPRALQDIVAKREESGKAIPKNKPRNAVDNVNEASGHGERQKHSSGEEASRKAKKRAILQERAAAQMTEDAAESRGNPVDREIAADTATRKTTVNTVEQVSNPQGLQKMRTTPSDTFAQSQMDDSLQRTDRPTRSTEKSKSFEAYQSELDLVQKEKERVKTALQEKQIAVGSPSSDPLTWSKCLVSLATCIDLANALLSRLMNARSGKEGEQLSEVLEKILPRLLTSLLTQKDIVEVMQGIFGEEHSQALGDFARHLNVVKGFLAAPGLPRDGVEGDSLARGLEEKTSQSFQAGSIQMVLGRLLELGDYLTPSMLASLRKLAEDWRDDKLCTKSIVQMIMRVHHELSSVRKRKANAKIDTTESSSPIGGVLTVLEQLLGHLSPNHRMGGSAAAPANTLLSTPPSDRGEEAATRRDVLVSPEPSVRPFGPKGAPIFKAKKSCEDKKPEESEHSRIREKLTNTKNEVLERFRASESSSSREEEINLPLIASEKHIDDRKRPDPKQAEPRQKLANSSKEVLEQGDLISESDSNEIDELQMKQAHYPDRPSSAADTQDPRRPHHHRLREKVSETADKIGGKLNRTIHPPRDRRDSMDPSRKPGLRIITEDNDEPSMHFEEKGGAAVDEETHPKMEEPDLHLPSATQDFLDGGTLDHQPLPKLNKRSKVVTPSVTVVRPGSSSPTPPPSGSSDSRYSDDSSEGTVESDIEAEELLGMADSGPGASGQGEAEMAIEDSREVRVEVEEEEEEEKPDEDQIKRAEDVLLNEEVEEVKREDKKVERERREGRMRYGGL